MDLDKQITAAQRTVVKRSLDSGEGRSVTISQIFDTDIHDVWDACTNPERIPRWFVPVSGDLRLNGNYQIEGNASGTIKKCNPPSTFSLSWEFAGNLSLVTLRLAIVDEGRCRVELEHTLNCDKHWEQYGAGATGVGWDMTFVGLATHLGGQTVDKDSLMSKEFMHFLVQCSETWGQAAIAGGEDPAWARAATDRNMAAYVPKSPEAVDSLS
jgi:uncharacterized protein YndB with AHSA1/START domain